MTTPADVLPDPKTLTPGQLRGEDCAYCGQRIGRGGTYLGQVIRTYAGGHDVPYQLWLCAGEGRRA